jgi:hypothetical protein
MKKNAQHTPGPWRTCTLPYAEGGRGQVVADVPTCFGSVAVRADVLTACPPKAELDAQGLANARLIAASPDLLAACKAVLERANGKLYDTDQVTGETFDAALRAAIAKAEAAT